MCVGKVRYPSQDAALRIAVFIVGRRVRMIRIYLCPACNGFHLTSRKAWV
jgi:hypothetical protein